MLMLLIEFNSFVYSITTDSKQCIEIAVIAILHLFITLQSKVDNTSTYLLNFATRYLNCFIAIISQVSLMIS